MSSFWTTMELAFGALLVIFIVSIVKASIRPRNFPPGPFCLPLLGFAPFLDVKNLGRSFRKLSERYGEIFSIYIGTKPVVVINSFPLIKEAYNKKEFSGRPDMYSGTFFQKGKSGVSTTEGEHWEAQRAFFVEQMHLLSKGKATQGFQDVILDEVHDIKMEIEKRVGEPTSVLYEINVAVINILWTITSGRRLHSQQQEFQAVYECIDKITQFMSRAAIMSFLPLLARILPENISKMEKGRYYRNRFLGISKKWIAEHKEDYRGNRAGDFQDAYLAKVKSNGDLFSEDELGAILREMFVIGAESESVLLRWAIRLISVYRDVQRKVQDEIDEVVSKGSNVTWEDRLKLPYTRATIAEVQRFADITPTGIGHKALCNVDFHGYHIPEGTHVMVNLTACHRNPTYWKCPKEFVPEHFLDEKGDFIENKEGFVPYGVGLRKCPASDVSDMQTFLIMANLMKDFSFRTPHKDDKSIGTQYESGTGFIRNPKPYKVVLHKRE